MTTVRDLPASTVSAMQGVERAVQRFEQAAETVAAAGPAESNAAVLRISDAARSAAAESATPDLEQGLVGEMVAFHELAANVRVLKSSEEMSRMLLDLIEPK